MVWDRTARPAWKRFAAAILVVAVSTAVRLELLDALGERATYVTFFPAVMAAALYGGFSAGLVATFLSAVAASFWWIEPAGNPLIISDPLDLLGMAVFVTSCLMISYLCEATHRANERANRAEAQAMVAAEREHAAAALGVSEERLRLAAGAAEMGVFEWNVGGDTAVWENDRMYAIFGHTRDDGTLSKERLTAEYLHPDDVASFDEAVAEAMRSGRLFGTVFRIRRKNDGAWRWVRFSGRFELNAEGTPLRLVGVMLDITEVKRAEEERAQLLEMAERRNAETEAVFAAIQDAVLIYDTDMNVVRVNPMFIPSYGFDPVGLNVRDIIERTRCRWMDGRPFILDEQPTPRAVRGESVLGQHYRITRPDGVEMALETSSGSLRLGDRVIGSVTVWHDITKRVQDEETLRDALERLQLAQNQAHVGVWDWNPESGEVNWSPELEMLYGLAPGTVKHYGDWLQRVHPEDIVEVEARRDDAIAGRRPFDVEFRILHGSGEVRWLAARGGAIHADTGRVLRVVGVDIDITELKEVQVALDEARAEAVDEKNRLEAVMEALPVGVGIVDARGGNIRSNNAYNQIWGSPRPDVESVSDYVDYKAWWADTGLPVRPEEWAAARAVQEGETVVGQLLQIQRFSGERAFVQNSAAPILDAAGKIIGSAVAIQDITPLREAELALRGSEARFRLLSETASRLLVENDPLEIVDDLFSRVMMQLDCQVFFNFLVDEQAGRLHLNAWAGIPEEEARKIEWLDYGVAVCGLAARDGVRIVAEDICDGCDLQTELVRSYGIRAYACHPLMADDRVMGTLSFGTKTRPHFPPQDLDLMKTVTDQVSVAMERVRLMGELQRSRDELEVRVWERTELLAEVNRALEAEIAERIGAETSLREKNELLEIILSTVHFLVAFLDSDFNFLRVNDAYARADGRPPEYFTGRNHFELYPNEENEAIFRRVVETGIPYSVVEKPFEYPGEPHRGVSYWDWSLRPVRGGTGEITGLVFCLLDVTERRHAQDALRQSEQLLRAVLETLPVGVWITDQEGKISMANPAAVKIWGGARYVGLDQYGEYKGWWADTGEPIAPEEWALARAITRGEASVNEMVNIQCFDGLQKTLLNSASPITNDRDEIVSAIVVNQDITELRQVENALRQSEEGLRDNNELLQKVVDGITDPLIMLDGEGRVKMINKAAVKYYGVAQRADVLGKPCFQGLRGRGVACPECEYPFRTAGSQSIAFERKGISDPGKVENVTVYPVLAESGRRDASIVRISDITQAKILERQILQNEKLASLGLVTSGIAHEINNPNSFIYFNIPILKKYLEELMPILDEYAALHPELEVLHMSFPELREDMFKLLENMEHGSQRINKIVGVLRSFVRKGESTGMQKVDLAPLIDKVVALCHAEMRSKVKSFEISVPEDLPPIVSDPEALEQVLLNLLINAVHACDKPDSRIGLKVTQGFPGGEGFAIEITDNGSGIDEKLRDRIFEPFFTTKPSTEGTGLGLYICHSRVESMGGRIEVESSVGQGSTFRILLPQMEQT